MIIDTPLNNNSDCTICRYNYRLPELAAAAALGEWERVNGAANGNRCRSAALFHFVSCFPIKTVFGERVRKLTQFRCD